MMIRMSFIQQIYSQHTIQALCPRPPSRKESCGAARLLRSGPRNMNSSSVSTKEVRVSGASILRCWAPFCKLVSAATNDTAPKNAKPYIFCEPGNSPAPTPKNIKKIAFVEKNYKGHTTSTWVWNSKCQEYFTLMFMADTCWPDGAIQCRIARVSSYETNTSLLDTNLDLLNDNLIVDSTSLSNTNNTQNTN